MSAMRKKKSRPPTPIRSGVPFTMYFAEDLSEALAAVSKSRRVSKATLVRFAVERLLQDLESGQLQLPFGVS